MARSPSTASACADRAAPRVRRCTWSAPTPPNLALYSCKGKVADKSNEITAIPELLEALAVRGLLVSIDAMSCQKTIAAAIRARGAHYLLTVKAN